jgi:hypothetical protein
MMDHKSVDAIFISGVENYYYVTRDHRRQTRTIFYRDDEPTIIVFAPEIKQVKENT